MNSHEPETTSQWMSWKKKQFVNAWRGNRFALRLSRNVGQKLAAVLQYYYAVYVLYPPVCTASASERSLLKVLTRLCIQMEVNCKMWINLNLKFSPQNPGQEKLVKMILRPLGCDSFFFYFLFAGFPWATNDIWFPDGCSVKRYRMIKLN